MKTIDLKIPVLCFNVTFSALTIKLNKLIANVMLTSKKLCEISTTQLELVYYKY